MTETESNPLDSFLYGIQSRETKKKYLKKIQNFFEFLKLEGPLETQAQSLVLQIKENGEGWITSKIMEYIQFHKGRAEQKEINFSTVRNYYKPIKLFFEMNDINLQWKKIVRGLPKGRKFADDRAPTIEEIQRIVEYPDRRIKAIISVMCSSGIRVGAWDYLKWSDITPMEQEHQPTFAKMKVYSGEPEQYFTFISPEAYLELKKWMEYRKESGENISGDSWLMRDLWDVEKYSRGLLTVPKKLQAAGVKRLIERALKAQGLRKKLPDGKRRHEFQTDHGFRKYFKTHAEQTMKPLNVELLMDHSTGISDNYYRPDERALAEDYLKAILNLTILPENRKDVTIQEQDELLSKYEKSQTRLEHLEEGIQIMTAMFTEQRIKNNIKQELENPTHFHTEKQIFNLNNFANSAPNENIMEMFNHWVKRGPSIHQT